MRSILRWLVGSAVAAALTLSVVPTAGALDIEGDLFWRDAADVYGILDVDIDMRTYLVQHLPQGTAAQDYAWSLQAEKLLVFSSQRQEPWDSLLTERNHDDGWNNATFEFDAADVRVTLTPSRDHGATALFFTDPGNSQVQVRPIGATPARVRIVDLAADLMQVPGSARSDSEAPAYSHAAPDGRLLEVSGRYEAEMTGDVNAAFFGWQLDVTAPDQETKTFKTGVRVKRDPTTGLSSGTILEYATVYAQGAKMVLAPMRDSVPLYSPLVRYSGEADYPAASYVGRNMDHAPQGGAALPINGDIWLSSVQQSSSEQNHVRAWGDTDWKARVAVASPVLPPPASALPLVAAFVGLSLTTHLLPALGRALRGGAFLLYARLRDQEPNANPTRERIYHAIVAEPGLNLSRIVERLDIGWGTAAYHVQILKRQTRVRELRFLNRVCFFPSENPDEARQLQTVLLRQPNYREVMTVVEAQPGLSQREVAGRTGHARQYISRLVAKMERAGLLRTEPSRMGRKYFPVPPRTSAVTAVQPAAPEEVQTPRPAAPSVTAGAFQGTSNPY